MEKDIPRTTGTPRKVKYQPKMVNRKPSKLVTDKSEGLADAEATQTRESLPRAHEGPVRKSHKVEKKSEETHVALGTGSGSALSTQDPASHDPVSQDPSTQDQKRFPPDSDSDDHISLPEKKKKEYTEPWNYNDDYPVTVPLRRPYSGNPELLDKVEFGEASENLESDENSKSSASELGLLEEAEGARMVLLQLPVSLPFVKRSSSAKGKEINNTKVSSEKVVRLDLPAGFMGKMLIYKSGVVKLKLGETLFDVSHGIKRNFTQVVAAVNVEEKHFCHLGELEETPFIVTPDIDSILPTL